MRDSRSERDFFESIKKCVVLGFAKRVYEQCEFYLEPRLLDRASKMIGIGRSKNSQVERASR